MMMNEDQGLPIRRTASADKYRRFERICLQQSKKIKVLRVYEISVTICQLKQLNNNEDLNFHDYETFLPIKMGKTLTQHNYYYIFEEKSFEWVINERTHSMLAEMPSAAASYREGKAFGCLYITVRHTAFAESRLRPILWCWRPASCPQVQPTTLKLHFGIFKIISRVLGMKQTVQDIHVEITCKSRIGKAKQHPKNRRLYSAAVSTKM
jgi:hypothetical protein